AALDRLRAATSASDEQPATAAAIITGPIIFMSFMAVSSVGHVHEPVGPDVSLDVHVVAGVRQAVTQHPKAAVPEPCTVACLGQEEVVPSELPACPLPWPAHLLGVDVQQHSVLLHPLPALLAQHSLGHFGHEEALQII